MAVSSLYTNIGIIQMNEQEYRKKLREVFTDFYKDVATAGYFEREKTTSIHEFYEYLDKWIEIHFPFIVGEDESTIRKKNEN